MVDYSESQSLIDKLSDSVGGGLSRDLSQPKNNVDVEDPQSSKPNKKEPSFIRRVKTTFVNETFQCVTATMILVIVLGLIVLSYMFCQGCLVGIMLISACLCPFISYWNIPLWVSIVLVTLLGINLVHKDVIFMWKA